MIGIILLAAGSSSRLGHAKQQVYFQGQTLLQRALHAAVASQGNPVIVVLGANAEAILPQVETTPAEIVLNEAWAEGMASSIRAGLTHLQKTASACTAALFMLCDQPYVTADLLNQLIQAHGAEDQHMVACAYEDTLGAPVLFPRKFFPALLQLQGQEGAKKLLSRFPEEVISIPFPAGAIDIDTPADVAALQANKT
ncbi:NTP transferase domain-containing protein [Rufibacter sediminis]|uniref:Nucleotidyltransferase family protein n=1 Tax=Rufibacter sediminis TaxID=2762756 RepID=A0ABR6VXF3_9BACT|nr:nucleotidyltransferase family protein [Rufibacter sediminis]MBC3541597.1 nucleotidyltransferase family protein [Rufibacter sediminis]